LFITAVIKIIAQAYRCLVRFLYVEGDSMKQKFSIQNV